MTIRTLAYLNSTLFASGQAAGAITPLRMQDTVDTLGARTPMVVATAPEYGADPTGVADSSSAIQAAITAATGGICFLPIGKYLVNTTLLLPSNTWLMGGGYGTWLYTTRTSGSSQNFVNNQNWNATFNAGTKVDQNLLVSGIRFDYGSLNDAGSKAVSFRMAQNCTVRDCWSSAGNNFTAMLACTGTLIDNCHMAIGATGFGNCAFDHWEGALDFTVRDSSAVMVGGNGLLCTGTDTAGTSRAAGRGLFDNVVITGGGVGLYMNGGATGPVTNVIARNIRFIGTVGGVVCDGPGGQHTIENIWWLNGGSSGSGDCAVRIGAGAGGFTPSDCFIDKIHVIGSQTAAGNIGMFQIGGLRHDLGSIDLVGAAISGTLTYFPTNSNGSVFRGPIFADAASIAAVTSGMYQDSGGALGTNTTITCNDPWNALYRHQGPKPEEFFNGVIIGNNGGLAFASQTSDSGASTGTLTNAPHAGNPTYWLRVSINGSTYTNPAWAS